VLAFVVLRFTNVYGDLHPWEPSARGPVYSFLAFLNVEKYPPSLCYLLVTLGPSLTVWGALETRTPGRLERMLSVFGQVPLFYYVLHLFVCHITVILIVLPQSQLRPLLFQRGFPGYSLPITYGAWALAILILYYPCRWFARVKARNRAWWLSYL
jgi:hypothetical protein